MATATFAQPAADRSRTRAWALPALGVAASLLTIWPIAATVYWPAEAGLDVKAHPIGRDFINVWAAPRLAFGGRMAEVYDRDAYVRAIGELFGTPLPFHNWSYPPSALALLGPFSIAPYGLALALWTALTFGAFAWAALDPVRPSRRWAALLLVSASPATLLNVLGGQNGFLTGALLLGGLLLVDRRPALAGALFGLLSIKPHVALVAPVLMLRLRAWTALTAAVAAAAVLAALSVALFGLEPWRVYLGETSRYQVMALERFTGVFPLMMSSAFAALRTFGVSPPAAWAVQAAVSLAAAAIAFAAFGRARSPLLRTQIALSAGALITPYVFMYDLPALSAVLVWRMLQDGPDAPSAPLKVLFAAIWLSPALLIYANVAGLGLAPIATGAAFAAGVWEAARIHPAVGGRPLRAR